MLYELIALLMFSTMMVMLFTGQRVFGAIGFVAVVAAVLLGVGLVVIWADLVKPITLS